MPTSANLPYTTLFRSYKLTASSGTLTPADSSLFNITHGAATQLKFTTNPSATYTADDTITVAVTEIGRASCRERVGPAVSASTLITDAGGDPTETLVRSDPEHTVVAV